MNSAPTARRQGLRQPGGGAAPERYRHAARAPQPEHAKADRRKGACHDAEPRRSYQHLPRASGRRGGVDRGSQGRRDRGRGPGCVGGGADEPEQPVAVDGAGGGHRGC